ncbi:phage recombination protein Bet [Phyllobacterium sp. 0TCS1.6C]|uniref:phage recombination protein Bet n=1 Tax=unclassified Phyllobacterium TaxID=2638441 RepID=UPI002264C781|nr:MULTISPECIES: phage recombination protein Bet [unclassified Phyllobacterium]MCX8282440.1 phage recombination protein Bet [Phyllobacterium sp. 0TCS1.6C]MCX8292532.1 phage recombination protein Bet [Phyllobacterium sp. 0TCS1.6A]
MNAVAQLTHTPRQLALIQNTVARDCNADEFNLFVEVARAKGLDPFLGQIIPMIFSKDDAKKRKMTIIISRDGQRVIAQRCGDYRPASKPPVFEYDTDLKGPTNPKGIVTATVYLWKQDQKSSSWYEVAGQVDWDEFAPIKMEADGGYDWVDTGETWQDSGKPKKKKVPRGKEREVLDDSGNWSRMPKLMIAKCAEMQALRAGWPEQFTGLYDEAEMDRAKVLDLTASELVEHEREAARLKLVAGNDAITVTWGDGWALENVPVGQFYDRAEQFIKESDALTVAKWADSNRDPLRTFWAKAPTDALALKKLIEAAKDTAKSITLKDQPEAVRNFMAG